MPREERGATRGCGSEGAIYPACSVYCNCPYKLVSIGLGYWDQNPGTHTRPDIPLTAIPLNRKRNGITDPGSGMQNQPCAANVWSPRPRVGHHIGRPPTCPNGGLLSIAATSDGTTRSVNANSAAQPRSSIVLLSDTSQTTSGCFHSVI